MTNIFGSAAFGSLFFLLVACAQETDPAPTFHAEDNPDALSEWGMVWASADALNIHEEVTPYDLATPLFSDYAQKLRTAWTPEGTAIGYTSQDVFEAPIGTVLTKTFYYPMTGENWNGNVDIGEAPPLENDALPLDGYRLIETRLLVRREHGWDALAYVWNDEQTDAELKRIGDVQPMTLHGPEGRQEVFNYIVPNVNQCAACHATNATTKAIQPIGLKARHLDKASAYNAGLNQLEYWIGSGLLEGAVGAPVTANANWADTSAPLEARARAYLDINCSHCHNPNGAADTSGLNLEPDASGAAFGRYANFRSPLAAALADGLSILFPARRRNPLPFIEWKPLTLAQ